MKYTPETHPVICVDLDGTILEDGYYPEVGQPLPYAIESINKLIKEGYEVIIWTSRGFKEGNLGKALQLLQEKGLNHNYKVNTHSNYCLSRYKEDSPKVFGYVYLDDRSYNSPNFKEDWPKIIKDFCN